MFGSFLRALVGWHHQSLLGAGSRHCYGIITLIDPQDGGLPSHFVSSVVGATTQTYSKDLKPAVRHLVITLKTPCPLAAHFLRGREALLPTAWNNKNRCQSKELLLNWQASNPLDRTIHEQRTRKQGRAHHGRNDGHWARYRGPVCKGRREGRFLRPPRGRR